jgi:hypothetical protein
MKKALTMAMITCMLSFTMAMPAFAKYTDKGWHEDEKGKWYNENKDGTLKLKTNSWMQESDGAWYYFGSDGYLLTNTTTPDGYKVDANGVWEGSVIITTNEDAYDPTPDEDEKETEAAEVDDEEEDNTITDSVLSTGNVITAGKNAAKSLKKK